MKTKSKILWVFLFCASLASAATPGVEKEYVKKIKANPYMDKVVAMAKKIASQGFNAGDGYGQVWIRDYNTFIELSMDVLPDDQIRQNLNKFFHFQPANGEIVDGFAPTTKMDTEDAGGVHFYSKEEPDLTAHKNTVETDQETSLVQAVYKYVKKSGNNAYLNSVVTGKTVLDRLEMALNYLYKEKYNEKYGLITGATTVDWGDVQPEHSFGVRIDENTHYAIDIYDNAMLLIALNNIIDLTRGTEVAKRWESRRDSLKANIRRYLWDAKNQKFIPHIYLNGSPFPADFDENKLYYQGGTAVAIQAGLLTPDEIRISNQKMLENQKKAHAETIGLTVYPPYPAGYFKGISMYPYGYQNGSDWTWFGARMIQALVQYDMIPEAYDELQPMLKRVVENQGFNEWYTPAGEPKGSGTFRGEAGVLYKAIQMLRDWAAKQKTK